MTTFGRVRGAVVVALIAALILPGCTTTMGSCIDWVYFETPADAVADADAVVVGHVTSQNGSTTYYDLEAATWDVSVDTWMKGDQSSRDLTVTSLPRSCGDTADSFAEAAGEGAVVLFLRHDDAGWQSLTPLQGIVAAEPYGGIPAAWPSDFYD